MARKRDDEALISAAFDGSKHRWRTARGLAKDTGISVKKVTQVLERSSQFIRSKKAGSQGQALFAKREKRPSTPPPRSQTHREVETVEHESSSEQLKYVVLIPHDASMNRLRDTIQRVIRSEHGEPIFPEGQLDMAAAWVDQMDELITTSDVVIADMTRMNPNVIYELGLARARAKPVILLLSEDVDDNFSLPAIFAGYPLLMYSPNNLSPFSERLTRTARQLVSRRA